MKINMLEQKGGCSLFLNVDESRVLPMGGSWVEEVVVSGLPHVVGTLSPNSEFAAKSVPHLFPIGSSSERTKTFKSSLKPTRFFDEVSSKMVKVFGIPKRLGGMVESSEGKVWKSAWTNTFALFSLPDYSSPSLKLKAMRAYLQDVMRSRSASLRRWSSIL